MSEDRTARRWREHRTSRFAQAMVMTHELDYHENAEFHAAVNLLSRTLPDIVDMLAANARRHEEMARLSTEAPVAPPLVAAHGETGPPLGPFPTHEQGNPHTNAPLEAP